MSPTSADDAPDLVQLSADVRSSLRTLEQLTAQHGPAKARLILLSGMTSEQIDDIGGI